MTKQRLEESTKDKFYVVAGGQIMIYKDKFILDKNAADFLYAAVLSSGADVVKNPKDSKEYDEALDFMNQVKILPFRIH